MQYGRSGLDGVRRADALLRMRGHVEQEGNRHDEDTKEHRDDATPNPVTPFVDRVNVGYELFNRP